MRTIVRHIATRTYKPILEKYLSVTRSYSHGALKLNIPAGVFHPGFFTSTKFLLKYVLRLPLNGKKLLELGAGSGLISLSAAAAGADVLATDINPVAVESLISNSIKNKIGLEILESDLFRSIPEQKFDIIAINPPYYRKDPLNMAESAWFCGKNGEYFIDLFRQLANYCHLETKVLMVLCEGCDMQMITQAANDHGWKLQLEETKTTILEKNYIFSINRGKL
jgi:release factor glutamine methyltransferase